MTIVIWFIVGYGVGWVVRWFRDDARRHRREMQQIDWRWDVADRRIRKRSDGGQRVDRSGGDGAA